MNKSGLMTKKIPTIFGVLILLGGLVAGVILVNSRQGLITKAGPTASPKNVKISNKTASGFTVSWTTDTPVTGFLKYSENPAKIETPAGDIRDQISGSSQSYTNHFVNVSALGPGKTYYFMIGTGSQLYNDNGKPFEVRTGPSVIPPAEDVVTGKIVGGDGNPVNGAIVYLEVTDGETLSTITKADGVWRLNLANSRDKEGKVLTYDAATTTVSIFVEAGLSGTATAITNTAKTKPVPDIVLGKNQTFIDTTVAGTGGDIGTNNSIKTSGFKNATEQVTPEQSPDATESAGTLTILNPAINGEMIATGSPEFRGKAPAGTTIKISVHSALEITQIIKADINGEWKWTAPQVLEPGLHTLTLEFTDEKKVLQKIVRSFTVLAADRIGGLPAFTATPSATITTQPTPTKVASMPATGSGTLTDSGALSFTIYLAILGMGLFITGRLAKKWLRD